MKLPHKKESSSAQNCCLSRKKAACCTCAPIYNTYVFNFAEVLSGIFETVFYTSLLIGFVWLYNTSRCVVSKESGCKHGIYLMCGNRKKWGISKWRGQKLFGDNRAPGMFNLVFALI